MNFQKWELFSGSPGSALMYVAKSLKYVVESLSVISAILETHYVDKGSMFSQVMSVNYNAQKVCIYFGIPIKLIMIMRVQIVC